MHASPPRFRRRAIASVVAVCAAVVPHADAFADAPRRHQLPTPRDLRVRDLDKVVAAYSKFPGRMYAGSLPMDHRATTSKGANPRGDRTGFLQFWLFVPDVIQVNNTMAAWCEWVIPLFDRLAFVHFPP